MRRSHEVKKLRMLSGDTKWFLMFEKFAETFPDIVNWLNWTFLVLLKTSSLQLVRHHRKSFQTHAESFANFACKASENSVNANRFSERGEKFKFVESRQGKHVWTWSSNNEVDDSWNSLSSFDKQLSYGDQRRFNKFVSFTERSSSSETRRKLWIGLACRCGFVMKMYCSLSRSSIRCLRHRVCIRSRNLRDLERREKNCSLVVESMPRRKGFVDSRIKFRFESVKWLPGSYYSA